MKNKGFKKVSLSFNRRMVAASISVTRKKSSIHSITEIDISEPRRLMKEHFEKSGEKLSFTAYITACLANVIKNNPTFNSFIKGKNLIVFDDLTISVMVERDLDGEKVPEPVTINDAWNKSLKDIQNELKEAKSKQGNKMGDASGATWINYIPAFLLKTFIRIADKNLYMAKRYGKVCITAVGMFSKEPLWFVPHGSATVLLTVGSISNKVVEIEGKFETREHLCLTASFDHDIVDGAPAARFMEQLIKSIKSGSLIN